MTWEPVGGKIESDSLKRSLAQGRGRDKGEEEPGLGDVLSAQWETAGSVVEPYKGRRQILI